MRIGFVCNEYPPAPHGGVGVYVKTMAEALVRRGHFVKVIGAYPKLTGVTEDTVNGVKLFFIPAIENGKRTPFFQQRLSLARKTRKLVQREGIDIIEIPEGGGWSMFFRLPCPVVIRLHNLAPYFARQTGKRRGGMIALMENLALRRADGISAVSQFIAREALDLYPFGRLKFKTLKVIYNGIDTDLYSPVPYAERVPGRIVFAGTLKPIKGVETLLAAFSLLAEKRLDCQLHLYGKDTMLNGNSYLNHLFSKLIPHDRLRERIHHAGAISPQKMPLTYGAASVCVFPSFAESFGLVAAEAMSCGRPVIYGNATAGPELIDHGRTGYLCTPDNPEELSDLIFHCLDNPEEAERIGFAATSKVKKQFSLEQTLNHTLQFYEKIISR
jgi:glycosyltransferase involved in cell wall biosynthesis